MSARGVSTARDLQEASRIISRNVELEVSAVWEAVDVDPRNVGSHFNQWRKPITEYGRNFPEWEGKLKASPFIGDIDFVKKEWAKARHTVDKVLDLLFEEIRSTAEKFEGLGIERYVRQGSSREGLKVIAPDEFDTLLLYHFDGVYLEGKAIETASNKIIPEFCKMTCNRSLETLQSRFPRLFQRGVFKQSSNGTVFLNSRALHQQVFQSIIDQSTENIEKEILSLKQNGMPVSFTITRKMNPPSINLTIHTDGADGADIDVDVVPGLLLRQDQVPDPARPGQTMDCPVYAVFKWTEESSMKASKFTDPDLVWRVCSSGYEKHTIDLARCNQQQRYIITALRILKTYFAKTKKSGNTTPPQIVTVLRSYHLKHIAFYVILHTQYIDKCTFSGVENVLRYFLRFLKESLERKHLPHFFHSNQYIRSMFPNYPVSQNALRFDLFGSKSEESLNQALLSYENHLLPNLGFIYTGPTDTQVERIVARYKEHISIGNYF